MESNQCYSESLDWEEIIPSPLELKEIKQKLLSGEKEKILQSAEQIKEFMRNDKSLIELIRADITEFLCDAIFTFDDAAVKTLYNCLESLTNHTEFFHHGHACFTIESLIRSIYLHSKNSHNVSSLNESLKLLVVIINRFNTYASACEKKTISSILQILPLLLNKSTAIAYCKYQTGELLLALLNLNILSWNQEFCESVMRYILLWFDYVDDILNLDSTKESLILLYCAISHSLLRFLHSQDNLSDFEEDINCQLKTNVILSISNFLINIAASYFNSVPVYITETNSSSLKVFFECILYLYSDNVTSQKNWITHGLSELGFFNFITRIISYPDISNCPKLQNLCMLVLSHMIVFLSKDVFGFPELWSNGQHNFLNEIHIGISRLPADVASWPDILTDNYSFNSCKLALLLLYYFYSMSAKSEYILEDIYFSIINFINFSNELSFSPLLQKIVWFVFVMSQLSYNQNSYISGESDATDKIVSLLEAQDDLSMIYTHHPALLYWGFSSKVSRTVQSKIVHLWFINKTSDCRVLQDLIITSTDVRLAIMDILQNGFGLALESAFLSLKSILIKTADNDLASSIWLLLAQVLAKFTTASVSATNVDYLIELASVQSPNSLDITKIIRIASFLPEIFLKSNVMAFMSCLILIFRVLELGSQMEDFRVICVFLRYDGFLQKILEGINANASETSLYSLKIVTLLWKNSTHFDNLHNYEKVKVNREVIVQILDNTKIEVLPAALDFVKEILLTSFSSNIMEIEELDSDMIQILFFQIENICLKNIPKISKRCWLCLKLFLMIDSIEMIYVHYDLISDPIVHEVINFYLPDLKDCLEMKDFLTVWLSQYNKKVNDCCFTRKIFGGYFVDTVKRIASSLDERSVEDDAVLRKEILKIGTTINN